MHEQDHASTRKTTKGERFEQNVNGDDASMQAGLGDDDPVVAARKDQGASARREAAAATAELEAAIQDGDYESLTRAVEKARVHGLVEHDTLSRAQQLSQMQHEAKMLTELQEATKRIRALEAALESATEPESREKLAVEALVLVKQELLQSEDNLEVQVWAIFCQLPAPY